MDFTTIKVSCSSEFIDIIIAKLFEIGFDSFQEFEDGFEGSCDRDQFSKEGLTSTLENYPDASYSIKEQEKVNWNEEWEKNYDPIFVDAKCIVRATFHETKSEYEYDIVVNPKMSFGTGHHATTHQVLSYQMGLDHLGKSVLDVGSGTGILAIMASKRGATKLVATDIDDWCIENSQENFSLNHIENVDILKGQIDIVEDRDFDIILANINKNVLLDQVSQYSARLKPGGHLLLSGFYEEDVKDLVEECEKHGLLKESETNREKWAMLAFIKQFV